MRLRLSVLTLFVLYMLFVVCLSAYADIRPQQTVEPPLAKSIDGYYAVEGIDADGETAYSGVCQIKPFGDSYRLSVAAAGITQAGVGQLDGNTFAVGWTGGSARVCGVTLYKREGRDLIGKWVAEKGDGIANPEKLIYLKPLAEEDASERGAWSVERGALFGPRPTAHAPRLYASLDQKPCPCGPNCPCCGTCSCAPAPVPAIVIVPPPPPRPAFVLTFGPRFTYAPPRPVYVLPRPRVIHP